MLYPFRTIRIICCCLLIVIMSSCKIGKSGPHSSPGHPYDENIHVHKMTRPQKDLIDEARTWIGTPYKYGGAEKGCGADCSGMVMSAYEVATGIKIPRNSAKQAEFCNVIDSKDVKIGDLVFFATGKDTKKVSHVGIISGEDTFIHSSSSKGVIETQLSLPYFQRTFIMFGRVPGFN